MLGGVLVPGLEGRDQADERENAEERIPGSDEFERLSIGGVDVRLAAKDDKPAKDDQAADKPEGDDVDLDDELDDDDLEDGVIDEDDEDFPEVDDDLIDLDDEWDDADEEDKHDNPHKFFE
jgi:hypothetical protein